MSVLGGRWVHSAIPEQPPVLSFSVLTFLSAWSRFPMNHKSSGTPDYPNLQFNVILLYSYTQKIYEELTQKNVTVDTIVKKLLTWQ